ncbi:MULTISPECIES: TRAP transporter large permease [Halomonadaceae]|jgi:tripartite ATP-independent transporter DctM subunit|nr:MULTISPECIES: TRAP transporter large permease subunit [Halomonas]NAO95055.1 TRAP transporter large permease subunit [Halomonas sp. MG34]UEQ04055.1 TRAP transporter large permease subunit [Halomonas profundus]KIN16901.1 C4-dicarboxylate ABC transporter [Halomonas sp. KHS3]MCD1588830.1 TRAP transporter large permease subunit [Halomonas sp. IOP_14]MCE7517743.1 TRAP transporter large permease subunit [Halomonas titanicae]|tara:strand:- start:1773 stop:3179 length:1407 start_codon:yes stop_codon:yes gene_type:complete
MLEFMPVILFAVICIVLMFGFPVALSLAGTALLFAGMGLGLEAIGIDANFDSGYLAALPNRLYGIMTNQTLLAVPLFVLMGVLLEKSKVAETLLDAMALLFGAMRGGLGISVTLVGMLMAASTGIVGATVVTMGLMSLPTMLKRGYSTSLATGTICATGTLGQIIPPSIALVLLGDVLSSAYQQAQLDMGIFSPKTVSVGDLFMGALVPGLLLVVMYMVYVALVAWLRPHMAPAADREELMAELGHTSGIGMLLLKGLVPPVVLIVAVLGSILSGFATPTEASAVGAFGALVLALAYRQLDWATLKDVLRSTTHVTTMVFLILIGAALFSLVFRAYGGEHMVTELFEGMPGGVVGATIIVMLVIFLLGFILDFIEITFVVVPIVGPILLAMGLDPIWLGIMIAINLQTSFLTPPFGFALFYLRGVAPPSVSTSAIYRGVIPFILMQLGMLLMLTFFPQLATWLPAQFG